MRGAQACEPRVIRNVETKTQPTVMSVFKQHNWNFSDRQDVQKKYSS